MRKHDIVLRMRGARFDQCDPDAVARFMQSATAMITRPGVRLTFGGCSANALRLRVIKQRLPAPEPVQPNPAK